jgi:hypothetical protein
MSSDSIIPSKIFRRLRRVATRLLPVTSLRAKILQHLPSRLLFAMRYMAIHRRPSLLIWPKTFNEKLSLRLAIDRRPLLVTLSDKLKVRDYITNRTLNWRVTAKE